MLETLLLIVILISVYGFARGSSSLAPWVPTKVKDYQRINQLIKKNNPKKFIDLGCGSAGLIIFLAKKNPDIEFVGVEIALPLFLFAWLRAKFFGLKNLKIKYQDLFNIDLKEFDIIFVYGYPRSIKKRLTAKIKKQAKPGALLLSYVFKFHELNLLEIDKPTSDSLAIFVYKF